MSPTSYQTAPPRKTIIAWWLPNRQRSVTGSVTRRALLVLAPGFGLRCDRGEDLIHHIRRQERLARKGGSKPFQDGRRVRGRTETGNRRHWQLWSNSRQLH